MLRGPSPGEPSPPRMQVVTHLMVQDSAFLDLGRWILAFLQSCTDGHSPDSVCGMLDSVSGASIAPDLHAHAVENIIAAATNPAAAAAAAGRPYHLLPICSPFPLFTTPTTADATYMELELGRFFFNIKTLEIPPPYLSISILLLLLHLLLALSSSDDDDDVYVSHYPSPFLLLSVSKRDTIHTQEWKRRIALLISSALELIHV